MPALPFSKWSPGGNTTLLFPAAGLDARAQARLAAVALTPACLGGEQAGFVDLPARRLRMAGGEFCVNASRAAVALLALTEAPAQRVDVPSQSTPVPQTASVLVDRLDEFHVSGWPAPLHLHIRGASPLWQVEARLPLPPCPLEDAAPGVCLTRLPGISHLLLDETLHPLPQDCHTEAAALRRRYGLDAEAAAGVVWWRRTPTALRMTPLVHVRDAGTTFLESACGSGALALALHLSRRGKERIFDLAQPGGSVLRVRLCTEQDAAAPGTNPWTGPWAGVDGPVALTAQGVAWLEDASQP